LLLRLLLFCLFLYVLYLAIKTYRLGRKNDNPRERSPDASTGDEMVLDPQCQTYIPKGEALWQEGKYFCSRECARLFLSR
jgi:uncharacterized protein